MDFSNFMPITIRRVRWFWLRFLYQHSVVLSSVSSQIPTLREDFVGAERDFVECVNEVEVDSAVAM